MGRFDAVSDWDYEAECNPQPSRVDLACTRCGDPVEWYPSDGPPVRPVTCQSCQESVARQQAIRNDEHRREIASRGETGSR